MTKLSMTINKADMKRITDKLKRMDPKKRNSTIHRAFVLASLKVEASLKRNISGKMLKVQTGRLRNSIESRTEGIGEGIQSIIGSGARTGKRLPYANIHEDGGIIKPKKGKYLTIPIETNRRQDGLAKNSAREIIDRFDTFLIPSRKGKVLMAKEKGSQERPKPMFAFVDEVTIKRTNYLSKTLKQNTREVIDIILRGVEEGLRK